MYRATSKTRAHVTAAIAAMWLAACGGGGGDDTAVIPPPVNPPSQQGPALGASFTAQAAADVWHSLSSSEDGQVMVAGQAGTNATENPVSYLSISTNGGQSFVENTALGPGIWIASDVSGDGNRIVAVQFAGDMFTSNDRGANFARVAGAPTGVQYESVTISQNGTRLAAVGLDGVLVVGNLAANGTLTRITPTLGAGVPAAGDWRSIDSSADGSVMVAVAQDPAAAISTDSGATWRALPVTVGGAAVLSQNWYRVKVSADGNTIVMVANAFGGSSGNGIYVSKDRGATFTRANDLVADYSAIAMSADGGVIAVTVSNANVGAATGQVLLSSNGGTSFAPVTITGATETDWRAVTMDGTASRMAVAAGRFANNSKGQIYLSTGRRP